MKNDKIIKFLGKFALNFLNSQNLVQYVATLCNLQSTCQWQQSYEVNEHQKAIGYSHSAHSSEPLGRIYGMWGD